MSPERYYQNEENHWNFLHISKTRGSMPVLTNHAFDESEQVVIVANAGAQLINSGVYGDRKNNPSAYSIIKNNESAVNTIMLGYSKPSDIFVYATKSNQNSEAVLTALANSYDEIGIPVSRLFERYDDIDMYDINGIPILPNVLSPEVVGSFADVKLAEPNTTYYKKHHHQQLWSQEGLPTPRTVYIQDIVPENISKYLSSIGAFDKFVVNAVDGSGGYNTFFLSFNEIAQQTQELLKDKYNNIVQIQGALPVISSPSVVANVTDRDIQIVNASVQRFKKPGVYAGSIWDRDLPVLLQEYEEIYMQAFRSLQKQGVRGQMNIDLLLLDKDFAHYSDIPQLLLREVNVRPSGSSIFNRLESAIVDNQPVERIHLATGIPLSYNKLIHRSDTDQLTSEFNFDGLATHVYNYDMNHERCSLAFLATKDHTHKDLLMYEEHVRSHI